ncbi:PaaI family thioesterase [Methylobacterium sp. Leaf108]|uniref:PaaI family thioesterase n=1 Tax=Methylobacterium sp. Leaf108 TaxID=1736256 RepID=UPI0006FB353A|nr:PaaI family thioesterase [Methylobacterium sp. Leaf108]KQP50785.1 phenylacetic acid degradation protein [Methylobacterium sp. Leaf108]
MSSTPLMSLAETVAFLEREFPQMHHGGRSYHLEAVGLLSATMRMDHHDRFLRPGGTVSGPAMMTLADLALYAAILANIGPIGLAVTTNLSFNFLRKPGTKGLVADARLFKLGRRLAVGEVLITEASSEDLVCHATGTYSIPPDKAGSVTPIR